MKEWKCLMLKTMRRNYEKIYDSLGVIFMSIPNVAQGSHLCPINIPKVSKLGKGQ